MTAVKGIVRESEETIKSELIDAMLRLPFDEMREAELNWKIERLFKYLSGDVAEEYKVLLRLVRARRYVFVEDVEGKIVFYKRRWRETWREKLTHIKVELREPGSDVLEATLRDPVILAHGEDIARSLCFPPFIECRTVVEDEEIIDVVTTFEGEPCYIDTTHKECVQWCKETLGGVGAFMECDDCYSVYIVSELCKKRSALIRARRAKRARSLGRIEPPTFMKIKPVTEGAPPLDRVHYARISELMLEEEARCAIEDMVEEAARLEEQGFYVDFKVFGTYCNPHVEGCPRGLKATLYVQEGGVIRHYDVIADGRPNPAAVGEVTVERRRCRVIARVKEVMGGKYTLVLVATRANRAKIPGEYTSLFTVSLEGGVQLTYRITIGMNFVVDNKYIYFLSGYGPEVKRRFYVEFLDPAGVEERRVKMRVQRIIMNHMRDVVKLPASIDEALQATPHGADKK